MSRMSVMLLLTGLILGPTWAVLAEEPKTSDDARIAVQAICPVTGIKLGDHGAPVAAKLEGEDLFLCCKGCVGKPAKPEHLKTIHANMAKAQGTCPVSGKALTAESPSLVVEGRTVFVCCPGCPGKVKSDPAAAIAKVDAQYAKAVPAKTAK